MAAFLLLPSSAMILKRQTIFACAAFLAMTGSFVGCGDDPSPLPHGPLASSSTSSSSSSSGSAGQAGHAGEGGHAAGGAGGQGGNVGGMGSLGTLEVVDVVGTPCTPLVGSITELYPDNSNAPAFSRIDTVATKRVAGGRYVPGFVTFGLDGTTPSVAAVGLDPDFDLVASEGSTIGLVTAAANTIRFQRYGINDLPIGSPVTLGTALGAGLAIAGDEASGGSMVIWAEPMNMKGRFVDAAGVAQTAFTFAEGISTKAIATSVTKSGTGFAAAWSSVDDGVGTARFARFSKTDLVGLVVDIAGPAFSHYVVKLIETPTGHALLLHSGTLTFDTLVVFLDTEGKPVGPARRFLGTKYAMDLAAFEDNLGLLTKRSDGSAQFRLLDSQGVPVGDWKCLDGPSEDVLDQAAIDAEGSGWAIVYRTPGGGEKFVKTNLAGTAAP